MHLVFKVQEVSQILKIHRPKVYELIETGVLEGFKLGTDWRITRRSIEKLLGLEPMTGDPFDTEKLKSTYKKATPDEFMAGLIKQDTKPEKAA